MEKVLNRGFEKVKEAFRKTTGEILLPLRGTETSAGYDFYATEDLEIKPQDSVMFWTDVKAKMPKGEVLLAVIRSSMGIKNNLALSNTIGVIDSDYYSNPSNDGNIGICIRNNKPNFMFTDNNELVNLTTQNTVHIKKGERVGQFIFVKFEEAENCNTKIKRTGGIGSTSK